MEVLGVPGLSLDWVVHIKRQGIVNSMGVLSKGYRKRRPWEAGETVDHKGCWRSHIKNLNLLVTL